MCQNGQFGSARGAWSKQPNCYSESPQNFDPGHLNMIQNVKSRAETFESKCQGCSFSKKERCGSVFLFCFSCQPSRLQDPCTPSRIQCLITPAQRFVINKRTLRKDSPPLSVSSVVFWSVLFVLPASRRGRRKFAYLVHTVERHKLAKMQQTFFLV